VQLAAPVATAVAPSKATSEQTMHALDHPAWSSLTTAHRPLSQGDDLARRYRPDINRFIAARDDSDEALRAMVGLVADDDPVYILQVPAIRLPDGLDVRATALGVQLLAEAPVTAPRKADDIVALDEHDAAGMLALATLTRPGPFLAHTGRMGAFFGIRIDGRLAAMAGERFRFPGHTELSGVCTHPDFRGRGLAGRLSRHVAARIAARGDTAFLHAWKDNHAAIALYEKLGFRWRCDVNVAVLQRPAATGTR
jgi:ribosomal protein S18 acetylase RimI-like enzyme